MSSAFFDGGCECGGTTGGKLGGGLGLDLMGLRNSPRKNSDWARALSAAALIVTVLVCALYTWTQSDVGAAARDTMMSFIFIVVAANVLVDAGASYLD